MVCKILMKISIIGSLHAMFKITSHSLNDKAFVWFQMFVDNYEKNCSLSAHGNAHALRDNQ